MMDRDELINSLKGLNGAGNLELGSGLFSIIFTDDSHLMSVQFIIIKIVEKWSIQYPAHDATDVLRESFQRACLIAWPW